jgi:predicted metal-dependent hydrolase
LKLTAQMAERLARGRVLFNSGHYFEAHEAWEDAWRVETGEIRRTLHGLIQIAAALHKASRAERPRGCLLLLDWGLAKLEGLSDSPSGLALARLRAHLTGFRERAEMWRRG